MQCLKAYLLFAQDYVWAWHTKRVRPLPYSHRFFPWTGGPRTQEISEVKLLAYVIYDGFPHILISLFTLTCRSSSIVPERASPTLALLTQLGFPFVCLGVQWRIISLTDWNQCCFAYDLKKSGCGLDPWGYTSLLVSYGTELGCSLCLSGWSGLP